jgi:hypothetical protein
VAALLGRLYLRPRWRAAEVIDVVILVELGLIDKRVAWSTGAIVWFHATDRDDDVK